MSEMKRLQEKDLQHIWHPCSQMKDYESFPPIVIERGEGAMLYDVDGKSYIDAVSSWWVNLFGHANPRINAAIARQVEKIEHVIFANFSHRSAIELAEKIVEVTPEGLNKVFFGDNGSSAVEIALKLSFQYHQQMGSPKKTKFVAIQDAYHGETIGALSVGDLGLYNALYKPLLLETKVAEGPDCFRCPFGLTRDTCQAECISSMESLLEQSHEEIAAVIVEPLVQCAAGMKIYPPIYLRKLRELCNTYNVHLIADEIAVGFGRTGKLFACEHAGISPDIMCLSKGLTAGYMPLSLVVMSDTIYDAFYDEYNTMKAFLHSHSYSGNALGCAIANETLAIFADEKILEKNERTARYMQAAIEAILPELPFVGEYRHLGMIHAIEFVEDKETKKPFAAERRVGYEIYKKAVERGVLLRPLGNIIYFMPPYVMTEAEIDRMVNVAKECVLEYFAKEVE